MFRVHRYDRQIIIFQNLLKIEKNRFDRRSRRNLCGLGQNNEVKRVSTVARTAEQGKALGISKLYQCEIANYFRT